MLAFIGSLLASGSTILYSIITAAGAVLIAWGVGKRVGAANQRASSRIDQLEKSNVALQARSQIDQNMSNLDDNELNRLRHQFERDEPVASELRGVAIDPNLKDRPVEQTNTPTDQRS